MKTFNEDSIGAKAQDFRERQGLGCAETQFDLNYCYKREKKVIL